MSVVQYDVVQQGTSLKWVERVVYLGHVLVMTNDNVNDIQRCYDSFCKQVNLFCARFGHLSVIIRRKLFQSFCFSFYGSQLWDLSNKELQYLENAWLKAIRRVCNCLMGHIQLFYLSLRMAMTFMRYFVAGFVHLHIVVYLALICV